MRPNSSRIMTYLIIGLIVIGILYNAQRFIIPIVVIGAILLLYKFPPDRWFRTKKQHKRMSNHRTTRKAKFRVIHGKKQEDDTDDTPKYH